MTHKRIGISISNLGVSLLQFIESDAEPLFALIDRNRFHLSQFGDTTAEKYPNFESVLQSIVNPPNPDKIRLGIWCDGELAGTVNLTPRDDGQMEIGNWIGEEYCRRGLAASATERLICYALRNLGCWQLIAKTHISNLASQGVLIKAGMTEQGRDREEVHFAITKE